MKRLDGTLCPCPLCVQLRARRAARTGSIVGFIGFAVVGGIAAGVNSPGAAIVGGISAFVLLLLSTLLALEA